LDKSYYATLQGNVISGNIGTISGNGLGGGLYLSDSDNATLDGNTISDNIGTQAANYSGGGLYLDSSDHATLIGNTIKGNTAGAAWSWGGGLYLASSNYATLIGNTIEGNTASIHQGWGGGLYLDRGSDLTLSGNVVISNTGTSNPSLSSWGGGVYIRRGGPFTLTNNVIVGNNVTTAGSGLYVEASDPRLLHTTIAHNTGGDGSGVYIADDGEGNYSTVAMINNVIVSHGVGITVTAGNTTTLNATLWHANTTDWGGAGTINHSNDRSGDPVFDTDGYHLTAGSAAIDVGVDAGVTTDIDGQPRPAGSGYDLGADEYQVTRLYLPLILRNF
jgi:parallel beta-helix repeat protein